MNSTEDLRLHSFHVIVKDPKKWSTDWEKFPGLPFAFKWETDFLPIADDIHQYIQDNWHYSIYISIVYVIVIHWVQWLMKDKKPFELRTQLAAWNGFLAVFSILGTIRCLPELIDIWSKKDFYASICDSSYFKDFRILIWFGLFLASKVLEFGDTFFIILRKQKLIYLHWIHHVVTLCLCSYSGPDVASTVRWMVDMNFFVHSIMYTYYFLKAMRVRISRYISISITLIQLAQMAFGLVVNIMAYYYKASGRPCDLKIGVPLAALWIYFLFFILFMNFFLHNYVYMKEKIKRKMDTNHNLICVPEINQLTSKNKDDGINSNGAQKKKLN